MAISTKVLDFRVTKIVLSIIHSFCILGTIRELLIKELGSVDSCMFTFDFKTKVLAKVGGGFDILFSAKFRLNKNIRLLSIHYSNCLIFLTFL